jgi:tryptophan synthase alpha chain
MNRIDGRIQKVLDRGEKFLCCVLPLGDPDLKTSRKILEIFLNSGVDIVELMLPSQNPYFDSHPIAESNRRSLQVESDFQEYFKTIAEIRNDYPDEPFEVMTYSDVVKKCGISHFVNGLREADVDAHLLADATAIAPDVIHDMDPLLEEAGIYRIRFMPHPFQEHLLDDIGTKARGFLILQSIADESGNRMNVAEGNRELVTRIRATGTRAAIMLGYGINNPARAKEAVNVDPDGMIVGTAVIESIASGDYNGLSDLIRGIKDALIP